MKLGGTHWRSQVRLDRGEVVWRRDSDVEVHVLHGRAHINGLINPALIRNTVTS